MTRGREKRRDKGVVNGTTSDTRHVERTKSSASSGGKEERGRISCSAGEFPRSNAFYHLEKSASRCLTSGSDVIIRRLGNQRGDLIDGNDPFVFSGHFSVIDEEVG